VLAVWCALAAAKEDAVGRRILLWVLAGVFCGVAALYKYQAALVGLALLVVAARDLKTHVARAGCLTVGFAVPFAAAALYFRHRGVLGDAIGWGILFNRSYLSEGPGLQMAASRLGAQLFGVVLPSLLFFAAGFVSLWHIVRRRETPGIVAGRAMLAVWALESIYCFTLGRRFFGHYLLQPELPLALLAAGPVASAFAARPRLTLGALAAPAAVFFGLNVLPELTSRVVYGDPDYWTVGRAAAERTHPGDDIWVWGNVPQIYYAAEREPGVRFTFCNYLTGLSPGTPSEYDPTVDPRADAVPGAWDMVVADLDARHPTLVLDTAAAGMKSYGKFPVGSFPVLARYLETHYRIEGSVNGVVFYRRIDPT
jgi:4-amino-4-deoxy-L-arabinose transferase-like glycosyltransferase